MNAHVHESSVVSGRGALFIGIVAAHVLALSVLMQQRLALPREETPPPLVTSIDPVKPVPVEQPAQTKVVLGDPVQRVLDVPLRPLDLPADDPPLAADPAALAPPVATAGPAPVIPATPLRYSATRSPNSEYPAASIRLEEQGIAIVRVCVGADGQREGAPTIQKSSGYARLDGAAVRWTSEALRFQPATQNGVAVAACQGFRVVFTLH